jgi:hypothetical protein
MCLHCTLSIDKVALVWISAVCILACNCCILWWFIGALAWSFCTRIHSWVISTVFCSPADVCCSLESLCCRAHWCIVVISSWLRLFTVTDATLVHVYILGVCNYTVYWWSWAFVHLFTTASSHSLLCSLACTAFTVHLNCFTMVSCLVVVFESVLHHITFWLMLHHL